MTGNSLVNYMYYRCLPELYREEDLTLGLPLYRYLQSLILGGAELTITDVNNLIKLVDPENCPAEFFPFLYESFGLTYYEDVDIIYHRRFLMNYGELKRRRGTYSCIRFLVRVLTGMDVKLSYRRGEYLGEYGRHLSMVLQARSIQDILNLDNDTALIRKFIGMFVPYYITVHVDSEIATQELHNKRFGGNVLTTYASYKIKPALGGE